MAHPLTDEICDQIQDSIHPCDPENMRTAADWQFEQVIEWIEDEGFYDLEVPAYKYRFITNLKEAMRPQQQENS